MIETKGSKIITYLEKLSEGKVNPESIVLALRLLGVDYQQLNQSLPEIDVKKLLSNLRFSQLKNLDVDLDVYSKTAPFELLPSSAYLPKPHLYYSVQDYQLKECANHLEGTNQNFYGMESAKDEECLVNTIISMLPDWKVGEETTSVSFILPTDVINITRNIEEKRSWHHIKIGKDGVANYRDNYQHSFSFLVFLLLIEQSYPSIMPFLRTLGLMEKSKKIDPSELVSEDDKSLDYIFGSLSAIKREDWRGDKNEDKDNEKNKNKRKKAKPELEYKGLYFKNILWRESIKILDVLAEDEFDSIDKDTLVAINKLRHPDKVKLVRVKSEYLDGEPKVITEDLKAMRNCLSLIMNVSGGVVITLQIPKNDKFNSPSLFVPPSWQSVFSALRNSTQKYEGEVAVSPSDNSKAKKRKESEQKKKQASNETRNNVQLVLNQDLVGKEGYVFLAPAFNLTSF